MKKVLIAGATGYLGRCAVKEFKKQGYRVRALARNPAKLDGLRDYIDEVFTGEVTNPDSLSGVYVSFRFYYLCTFSWTRQTI